MSPYASEHVHTMLLPGTSPSPPSLIAEPHMNFGFEVIFHRKPSLSHPPHIPSVLLAPCISVPLFSEMPPVPPAGWTGSFMMTTPQSSVGCSIPGASSQDQHTLQQGFNTIVLGGREEGRQAGFPRCEMETIFSVEKILNITRKSEPESGREKEN